jgi:hypothetical protein
MVFFGILWNFMELFVSEILGEVEFSGIVHRLIGLPPNIMTCLKPFFGWVFHDMNHPAIRDTILKMMGNHVDNMLGITWI